MDSTLSSVEKRLETNRNSVPELERASAAPFAQAAELEQKRKRQAEILVELSDDRKPSGESVSATPETDAFRESASATPEISAFRDTVTPEASAPAWEIVEDESGVLKFRDTSAAKNAKAVKSGSGAKAADAGKSAKAATTGSHPERWTAERIRDGNPDATPKPIQDIIMKGSRDLGVHVGFGHVRGAKGQYMRKDQEAIGTGGVRVKSANDLPTTMHEFGHAIDDKYHFSETLKKVAHDIGENDRLTKESQSIIRERLQAGQELLKNMDPDFASQYPKEKQLSEGVAEFFRMFMQNRDDAQEKYPVFYKYVMRTLTGKDQAILLQMSDDVNAYYSLDTETMQSAIRPMNERRPDGLTFKQRAAKAFDKYAQLAYDSLRPVRIAAQSMGSDSYKLFYNALAAASQAEALLTGDLRDLDGAYVGPGLKAAWRGVNLNDPEQYADFGEYMVSRHGPSWVAREQRVIADDRKNATQFFERREQSLNEKYPDTFKDAFEKYKKWKHDFNFHYLVESGLLSQEGLEAWETIYPDYVPMFRVLDGTDKALGSNRLFANQDVPTKAARGSGLMIISPIDGIISQVPRIVQAAVRNRAMLSFIDAARKAGIDAAIMEQIPVPLVKRTADVSGLKVEIANALKKSNLSEKVQDEILEIIQQQGDILEMFEVRDTPPKGCISVRRNGELEWYKVNEPNLLRALTTTGRPDMSNAILKGWGEITRRISALQTGLKVTWAVLSNPPRDLLTALVYSDPKHRLKLIPNMFDTYRQEVLHKMNSPNVDPLYLQYLALGGDTQNTAWSADRDLGQRIRENWQGRPKARNPAQAGKNVWKDFVSALEFVGNFFETGPRYATFKMCMQDGMDPQSAMYAAHEITVYFQKGGEWSRTLNLIFPFFNAAVQSIVKSIGVFVGAKLALKAAYLAVSLVGAVIEYFWNNFTPERKKNYERLSTYTKNAYWVLALNGDGNYFTLPKNHELAVPLNFFRAALERYVGGNPHAFDAFWSYAATASLPNGIADIMSGEPEGVVGGMSLIGPVHQADRNADFRGVPIESAKELNLPAHQRYNGATSKMAKAFGDLQEKIGVPEKKQISPKMVDFLGSNLLGAAWQYPKALLPVDSEYFDPTLGVKSLYFRDSLYSNSVIDRLYDLADESSKLSNGDPHNTDKEVTAHFDSAMKGFYGRYNALARTEDKDTDAARHLRDLVLTMTEEYLQARENGDLTAAQRMVYDVCRKAGDTSDLLPSVLPTVVTDGDGAAHNLTAAQYYDYQGEYDRYYWHYAEIALPQVSTDAEKQSVLKDAADAAAEMAKNSMLIRLGAKTTDKYKKYADLQLYSVPISTYLVAHSKTRDIEGLKDKRTKDTITNSKGALIAEAVREMELDLPETNLRMLMDKLGVDDTVLDWKESKLTRKLKEFRKDAGIE